MIRKHLFLWILVPSFFFINGCEQGEDLFSNKNVGKIKTIQNEEKQVIAENTWEKGLLTESWQIDEAFTPNEKAEFTYSYNKEGLLTKKMGYLPGIMYMSSMTGAMGKDLTVTYEYDDQSRVKKIRTEYDYGEMEDINYSTLQEFDYTVENRVRITHFFIHPAANSIPSYSDYFFNEQGNIERMEVYTLNGEENRITSMESYTWDSKKAPYNNEPGLHSKNNKTKRVQTAYNYDEAGRQSVAYTSEFSYEYTYNSEGYPVSQTETWPNETVFIRYFNY